MFSVNTSDGRFGFAFTLKESLQHFASSFFWPVRVISQNHFPSKTCYQKACSTEMSQMLILFEFCPERK